MSLSPSSPPQMLTPPYDVYATLLLLQRLFVHTPLYLVRFGTLAVMSLFALSSAAETSPKLLRLSKDGSFCFLPLMAFPKCQDGGLWSTISSARRDTSRHPPKSPNPLLVVFFLCSAGGFLFISTGLRDVGPFELEPLLNPSQPTRPHLPRTPAVFSLASQVLQPLCEALMSHPSLTPPNGPLWWFLCLSPLLCQFLPLQTPSPCRRHFFLMFFPWFGVPVFRSQVP